MTVDEIRDLINLAKETGVALLEVQRGANRVRIRLGGVPQHVTLPAVVDAAAAATAAAPASPATTEKADAGLLYVRSPIVGTFYEAPSPGAPSFVGIGDRIQPGKVLCIIESMKLMNEIEAEVAGIVETKLVSNGQPVEYGEALFAIRPV
jgi:acetyl-CoA carboxylase biotin carboxyl carrier protein